MRRLTVLKSAGEMDYWFRPKGNPSTEFQSHKEEFIQKHLNPLKSLLDLEIKRKYGIPLSIKIINIVDPGDPQIYSNKTNMIEITLTGPKDVVEQAKGEAEELVNQYNQKHKNTQFEILANFKTNIKQDNPLQPTLF